jgi:aminopeptidase
MTDPRVEQYAEILVDKCLTIEAGDQVVVSGGPLGKPLIKEVARRLARKDAYALLRITLDGGPLTPVEWSAEASMERLAEPAPMLVHEFETADALIVVDAPENVRDRSALDQERQAVLQAAHRPLVGRMLEGTLQWTGCQYPTPALAQEAGMATEEFAEFLYGAVLRDWEAERERMQRYCDRFDAAREVRIVGPGTDLRLSLEGRTGKVDAYGANIPGGEFFFSPVEDSAEGEIEFSEFAASYGGRDVEGIRLRFEGGRVVEASARTNEDYLLKTLDVDDGARRVGELGVGCNPGITRYMKNVLFDEKMDGTVHIALGNGFPFVGGSNESSIHWDIVKDLRSGGRIELDGEVVQENGVWTV